MHICICVCVYNTNVLRMLYINDSRFFAVCSSELFSIISAPQTFSLVSFLREEIIRFQEKKTIN